MQIKLEFNEEELNAIAEALHTQGLELEDYKNRVLTNRNKESEYIKSLLRNVGKKQLANKLLTDRVLTHLNYF